MKSLLKVTLLSASVLFAVGCSEEFLEKEPSEFLTQQQVSEAAENNPDVLAGTLSGIYSLQFQSGTGGTGNHDDFGQKGYDIYGDMLSGDVALSVSSFGWYRSDITEFQAPLDFTSTRNYMPWRYYYRLIRSSNVVIAALGGNDAEPEVEENRYILGQAKAMRAHSYFYLTQYFQKSFNPSEEILPLYTSPEDENGPKVPASEIYALIEKDLNVRDTEQMIKLAKLPNSPKKEKKEISAEWVELRNIISQSIGASANIRSKGNGKGEIVIPFKSDSELNKIIERLEQ